MASLESVDQPNDQNTHKSRHRHRHRSRNRKKGYDSSKFFMCIDYGFLIIFIGVLCFVLLKLVGF